MKAVSVIQARMGSTRLPGKVLMTLHDKSLLEILIARVRRAAMIDQIIVATSTECRDDEIAELISRMEGVALFRGSEQDVLSRFSGAVREVAADLVMRITADNPFFDWILADRAIAACIDGQYDYLSTPGYPVGIGMEIFTSEALKRADSNAAKPYEREHVTAYLYRNPQEFKLGEMKSEENLSNVRLTVDTPEDLARARELFKRFGPDVTYREVVNVEC